MTYILLGIIAANVCIVVTNVIAIRYLWDLYRAERAINRRQVALIHSLVSAGADSDES